MVVATEYCRNSNLRTGFCVDRAPSKSCKVPKAPHQKPSEFRGVLEFGRSSCFQASTVPGNALGIAQTHVTG